MPPPVWARAIAVHSRGDWPEESALDTVTLAYVDRHRRRIRLVADSGEAYLLDLPRAHHLVDGDGLELDCGGYLHLRAAAEPVYEIEAAEPADLLRIAWHLGNRHLPLQVAGARLRIRADHVIAEMVAGWADGSLARRRPSTPKPAFIMSMHDPKNPAPAPRERGFSFGLYRLLTWLSPGFPAGSFAFSHSLEAAAASGAVRDRYSLQLRLSAIVASGGGRIDADILRDAHRATSAGDIGALADANRRGVAFRATAETRLETTAQGEAFLATCRTAWPDPVLDCWAEGISERGKAVCYAAAIGAATAQAGIPRPSRRR